MMKQASEQASNEKQAPEAKEATEAKARRRCDNAYAHTHTHVVTYGEGKKKGHGNGPPEGLGASMGPLERVLQKTREVMQRVSCGSVPMAPGRGAFAAGLCGLGDQSGEGYCVNATIGSRSRMARMLSETNIGGVIAIGNEGPFSR